MTFEPVIKLGDVLTFLVIAASVIGFIWALRGDIRMLSRDVRVQGRKIDELGIIVTKQAVQDQRLNDLDRRIEELRHGRGFVQRDLDGMWGNTGKAAS